MAAIYFITGISGAGKTTIVSMLKKELPDNFCIYDFDQRGVPEGVNKDWRLKETRHWLGVTKRNKQKGVSTVICGLTQPDEIKRLTKGRKFSKINFCLLNITKKEIEKRLKERFKTLRDIRNLKKVCGSTLEEHITNNFEYAKLMRKLAKQYNSYVIENSHLSKEQTVNRIVKWILNN